MEGVRTFLESSTIHGLAYIATSGKYVRLLCIIIVFAGFTCAGFLIYASFNDWSENPIKTTIETRSIKELIFPKVTVCPPKHTYTDLNYDLMMLENTTLDADTRNRLVDNANDIMYDSYAQYFINEHNIEESNTSYDYGKEKLYDAFHKGIMKNLSILEDKDRYYNWYHGYNQISLPSYMNENIDGYNNYYRVNYNIHTTTTCGTIYTQHFGEKFDVDKIHRDISYQVTVTIPESVDNNPNISLHFKIELILLKNISRSRSIVQDCFSYAGPSVSSDCLQHNSELILNFTELESDEYYFINLKRKVSLEDLRSQSLEQMPGFRVTWYYSGMEEKEEVEPYYYNEAFIR